VTWDRKEVANLLMVGAGIIAAIQTAILGKWVDAKASQLSVATSEGSEGFERLADVVATVGLVSTVVLAGAWVACRYLLGRTLKDDKLKISVASVVVGVYCAIAIGWTIALCV